jgi:S1-C subfamily serine protease
VILSVNGRKPSDAGHLMRLMRQDTSGQPLKLRVVRQNKRITVTVRLGANARITTGR